MEPSSIAFASVLETVQSDNDDTFADFEDFCLRISESFISFDTSDKESDRNQDMNDSVKMIEATEGIKCNVDVNIEQIQNCIENEQSENVQMIDNIGQSEDVLDNIGQCEDVQNGLDEYDSSIDAATYDGFALYEDDDEEGKECVINTDEKIVENILECLIKQIESKELIQEHEDKERDEITIESNDAEMEENDDSSSDMDIELDSVLRNNIESNVAEIEENDDSSSNMDIELDSVLRNVSDRHLLNSSVTESKIEDTHTKKIKNNAIKQKQEIVAIPGPSKPAQIISSFDKLNSRSRFNIPEINEYIKAAITEWIADTGLVGHERTEFNRLKTEVVTLRAAVFKYQKQCEDVKKILKKMIEDRKATLENPQILPRPAKVTRSVALQVCILGPINMQLFGSEMPVSTQSSTILPSNLLEKLISPPTPLSRTGQPLPPSSSELQHSTSRMDVDLTFADEDVIPVSSSQIQIMSSNGEYKAQSSSANATAKTKETPQTKKTEDVEPSTSRMNIVDLTDADEDVMSVSSSTSRMDVDLTFANEDVIPVSSSQIQIMSSNGEYKAQSSSANATAKTKETPQTKKTEDVEPSTSRMNVVDLTDADEEMMSVSSSPSGMDVVNLTDADEDVIPIPIVSSNGEYKAQSSRANATAKTKETPQTKKTEEVQPTKIRPLPRLPSSPISSSATRPPIPILQISRSTPTAGNLWSKSGIMLRWNFRNKEYVKIKIPISNYEVFAYQEGGDIKENWKKVGEIAALPLPMACTLTQFKEGFKYYFAVRAVDKNMAVGEFSSPGSIRL